MKRIIFLLFIAFCFEGFCMKSISVNVQGVNDREYIAHIRNEPVNTAISLRNSHAEGSREIHLKDGPFLVILAQDSFIPQVIDVGPNIENKVFSFIIEKNHPYNQPTIKLIIGVDSAIKCALYRQRAGGGNSFVLAVGDSDDAVSVASVKKHQKHGAMQAFERIF